MDLTKYQNRQVVWVDESDNELGVGSLIEAHRGKGRKHRAFSLVLYRPTSSATSLGVNNVEVLLQKRAGSKPVFAHYWANTCCYNMAPSEEYLPRAVTRVREEMGVEVDKSGLHRLYTFSYYAPDPSAGSGQVRWCENELDTVIVGEIEKGDNAVSPVPISPNPAEAEDYRWVEWKKLKEEMKKNPNVYAPWWKMIVADGRLEEYLNE